ncbi:MAG: HlyD family efflux transporter periplasmic adaptor subunit [Paracoccaceae bacterium]
MSDLPTWLVALIAFVIPGFGAAPDQAYNGYVEADYLYVAPSSPGRITAIHAREGDWVTAAQELVVLDDTSQRAALNAAKANVAVAEANLDNLMTGSREAEIEVIRASLANAEADQHLAQITLDRSLQLSAKGLVPPAQVDTDRARLQSANAQVAQLKAQLKVAELPARSAQQLAAEATLEGARAEVDRARSALEDRLIAAPEAGLVDRIYFDVGEVAATGAPVLSLYQPERLKAIFFVPEPERASFAVGDILALSCDGCPAGLTASVTRLSSSPQHTPPILYSRDERARLVFRAEATLAGQHGLLPGQPITLRRVP